MGHLVVLLPALAQLHGPQRRRSGHHLLHQLTRHPCAHVLLRPDPRQSGPQTASRARDLHDRGARRALRAVHLRAAHAHQHDGRRNDRLHRAVRGVHGRLFAHRGRHRTVQPQVQLRIRPVARLGLLRLRDRGARRRHRVQHQPDDQLLARLGVRRRHAHRVPHVVPGRPARGAQGGIGTGRGAHQPLTQRDGQGAAHAGPVGAHRVHAAHQHVLHRVRPADVPHLLRLALPHRSDRQHRLRHPQLGAGVLRIGHDGRRADHHAQDRRAQRTPARRHRHVPAHRPVRHLPRPGHDLDCQDVPRHRSAAVLPAGLPLLHPALQPEAFGHPVHGRLPDRFADRPGRLLHPARHAP